MAPEQEADVREYPPFAAFRRRSGRRVWWHAPRHLALGAVAALVLACTATGLAGGPYYEEISKDGCIFVFSTPERFKAFQASGDPGRAMTPTRRGPKGETVVAQNRAALDLVLFKHDLPAYDPPPEITADPPRWPQVKVGSTIFLSYQDGTSAGAAYSKFVIKRGYLDLTARLSSRLSARITPDVTQDASGEMRLRLKYGYGAFSAGTAGWATGSYVEFGMIHTPWIDFEEKVDRYRMQDSLFLERVGIMSSADLGIMAVGLLGGEMPGAYTKGVSGAYPGRYGSFAVGVYNGGGYTVAEQNTNKVVEGRLSVRPLPGAVPGLQVSYFGVSGRGNSAARPQWTARMVSLTYSSRAVNAVGSYLTGRGNARGDAVDVGGRSLDREGWTGFVEAKLSPTWSVIARRDEFTPDTRSTSMRTTRTIFGVAYHVGNGADVLLDRDELTYGGTLKPSDERTQLTLQIKF
jgi:hypothetical protein